MKIWLIALLLSAVGAIKQRSLRGPEEVVAKATTDEILAEMKHRVEVCGESKSPLAALGWDGLVGELQKREAAKKCEGKAPGAAATPGAGPPAAAAPADAPAAAAPGDAPGAAAAPTPAPTTTTTTPCPDNFMDEIVDQANVEFGLWDQDKDGCLSDKELTAPLRKQIEIARQRDYYWIRRNITNAARGLAKNWTKDHAKADESGNGCLDKEEMQTVHDAICDCATQFMFMDHNADGKISQQEAATYVSDHMLQADINYVTLSKIFKAADVDSNKYLSEKEFCEAGPRYHGDGKDWLPPGPAPGPGPAPR